MLNPLVPLIVDELLAYVSFYRNNSNIDALRRTVLSFYSPTNICSSTKLLVDKLSSSLIDSPLVADRRSSSTRASHEAEIDDILNLIDILDLQSEFSRFKFVVYNLDNFPKFGPEEINIAAVVNQHARVEASVRDISSKVHELVTNLERLLLTESALKDMVAAVEQIVANSAFHDPDIAPTSRLVVDRLQRKLQAFGSSACSRFFQAKRSKNVFSL